MYRSYKLNVSQKKWSKIKPYLSISKSNFVRPKYILKTAE